MPFLGSIDFWAPSRPAEDIVHDNVEWNDHRLLVKEARYRKLEELMKFSRELGMNISRYLTRTRSPATNPRTKRMTASMNASLLLKVANMSSSSKKGADKAIENGQPSIPPIEK